MVQIMAWALYLGQHYTYIILISMSENYSCARPTLAPNLTKNMRILCGAGRWAVMLHFRCFRPNHSSKNKPQCDKWQNIQSETEFSCDWFPESHFLAPFVCHIHFQQVSGWVWKQGRTQSIFFFFLSVNVKTTSRLQMMGPLQKPAETF